MIFLNDKSSLFIIETSCFLGLYESPNAPVVMELSERKWKRKNGMREAADPGSERTKEQGGAAPGRVRGRVSRRTSGSWGRRSPFRCDEDGEEGSLSRANAPRNAKSKCRWREASRPSRDSTSPLSRDSFPFGSFSSNLFVFARFSKDNVFFNRHTDDSEIDSRIVRTV